MNERDKNRYDRLERLFTSAGPSSLPTLTPDPALPSRIRALAAGTTAAGPARAGWARPRWAWVPLAGVAVALSILAGGLVGYHAWLGSAQPTTEDLSDVDVFVSAWSQSGLADDLTQLDTGEVRE